jgi:hypothetical protein
MTSLCVEPKPLYFVEGINDILDLDCDDCEDIEPLCVYIQYKGVDLGPLHTRDWKPVTITLQALSLVEKAEPVQVRFTLRLRDQWSM